MLFLYLLPLFCHYAIKQIKNAFVCRNIFCALCHGDAARLANQSVSVACDNWDLAQQCGLATRQLLRAGRYLPRHLRWDTQVDIVCRYYLHSLVDIAGRYYRDIYPQVTNCSAQPGQLELVKCWAWLTAPPPGSTSCTPPPAPASGGVSACTQGGLGASAIHKLTKTLWQLLQVIETSESWF